MISHKPVYSICIILIVLILTITSEVIAQALSKHARDLLSKSGEVSLDSLKVIWRDSAYSDYVALRNGHSDNDYVLVQRNHSYITVPYPFPRSNRRDVVVISQTSEWVYGPWEGNGPWLEAKATYIDSSGIRKSLWAMSEDADVGQMDRDFYSTIHFGDGSPDLKRLYRLRDGAFLTYCADSLVAYSVQDGKSSITYFVSTLGFGAAGPGAFGADSLAMSNVCILSADSCLHVIRLRAKSLSDQERQWKCGNGHCRVSVVNADTAVAEANRHTSGWFVTSSNQTNSLSRRNRAIKVEYDCDTPVFIIPVRGDNFVLERTDFPGYEIVRVQ